MKYIALLSGGKDSCYNLLHCAKNGHELIAAASLGPQPGKEEIDSYLYQTVGQDAIEFVSEALEIPLYRRVITGDALDLGSEYGGRDATDQRGTKGDETEDLFALLSEAKSFHPDVQGVSVGAILSNYQRVRVENVCSRLGLTPLCFLWQRDQEELLSEMINGGLDAVLIKVAGMGLGIKHLGQNLAAMQPTLLNLNRLYGSHICGEGGEYETLALDCPLFKRKINLEEVETVIHSNSSFATVAFLRIKKASLEPKPEFSIHDAIIAIPPLLEDRFLAIKSTAGPIVAREEDNGILESEYEDRVDAINSSVCSKMRGPWVSITNVQISPGASRNISVEEEVRECFKILTDQLQQYNLRLSNCTNINIFLSSIELFREVNSVYSSFFGTSPPARACVALDLPHAIRIRLDCIAFSEKTSIDRQALHVQSLSYWAPANIGPYSQAIMVGDRIFISGQIGLIPSALALPGPRSLMMETALAEQHVSRIVEALESQSGSNWKGHTQAAIYWLTGVNNMLAVRKAVSSDKNHKTRSPTMFVVVKALPKDALVEKQVMLHTGRCFLPDEDDEIILQDRPSVYRQEDFAFPNIAVHYEVSTIDDTTAACAIIFMKGDMELSNNIDQISSTVRPLFSTAVSVRLFHLPGKNTTLTPLCRAIFGSNTVPPATFIPCRSISTLHSDGWDLAFCIFAN